MNIPADLKYTKEHEWIKLDGDIATIGITDYAQSELGELVYVEVDTIDDELAQNEVFGTVEAVKTTSDLFMPLAGKVLEMNPELDEDEGDNPTAVNEDPYGKGWIIKVKVANKAEFDGLLDAEAYQSLIS